MTERLLQFIWQFQYFNTSGLETTGGEAVRILARGTCNHHQGPDFSDARIRIDGTTWVGNVELHLKTGDWLRHGHQEDPQYRTVILHVVWEDDRTANDIPVVELNHRVSKHLLDRYERLMASASFIACEDSMPPDDGLRWTAWKERLIAERLTRRASQIRLFLNDTQRHWEEVCWWMIARNFGLKVNADAFESIARTLPVKLLAKHRDRPPQIEALLFGQAGLLHEPPKDDYTRHLHNEYNYLRQMHSLSPIKMSLKFLRMRPGNFPTVRLAQLAALISRSNRLFSKFREAERVAELEQLLEVTAGEYWDTHYRPGEPSAFMKKKLGAYMIGNILTNTVAPIIFAAGFADGNPVLQDKAIRWLLEIVPESNEITRGFERLGIHIAHAHDSQALLELKTQYCCQFRCLDCTIGNRILRESTQQFP